MTVLVVDLSAIVVPHYYAHGQYHGGTGTSDAAIRSVRERAAEFGDSGVAICCDCPNTPTWRHELCPSYKADRDQWPDHLIAEYERTKSELAKSFRVFAAPGFEGEDLCYSVLFQLHEHPVGFVIASADKDLLQLVCRRVRVWDVREKRLLDSGSVLAKFGVQPRQIRDWLCLVGDTSDGIEGVRHIGKGRASALLGQYGSIDEVLRAAIRDKSGDKIMQSICAGVADAELAYKLVTLRKDAPIDCSKVLRRDVA